MIETKKAWQSHVTVAAIIKRENRYLMVKEKTSQGIVYNQPAGHWEKDETLVEACIRETFEETGQSFTPQHLVGIYNCPHHSGLKSFVRFTFFGEISYSSSAKPLDDDIISTHWLSLEEIATLPLRGDQVIRSINDYLKGNEYPLDMIVDFKS